MAIEMRKVMLKRWKRIGNRDEKVLAIEMGKYWQKKWKSIVNGDRKVQYWQ